MTLLQPKPPTPPDAPWTFGGVQRIALREACPNSGPPLYEPRPVLRVVESEERA